MIQPRAVHEHDVRREPQCPDGSLEQRPFAKGKEARHVGTSGSSVNGGRAERPRFAGDERHRGNPQRIAGAADPDETDGPGHEGARHDEAPFGIGPPDPWFEASEPLLERLELPGRRGPADRCHLALDDTDGSASVAVEMRVSSDLL